ncbi:M81 family metallopeptidase [uncultured Sneathiella sp.]|uniref:M81 family metallopeptidase n=1 Tax=uncultured Sneathiella sp. TaxID=879315 RepID=UPI0030DD0371
MRILIAMMKHETNTFSPIVADWKRFQDWGAHLGENALKAYEGTAMPFGAYVALAREAGAEIVTPVAAEAMPSGPVTEEAYNQMAEPILEAVRSGVDAAMLDLHGAMVATHTDDGEGTLLEKMRAIDPDLPIAVTLDLHCNLTDKIMNNCTALIGYKTYPHVDMYEVGAQIGRVLLDSMAGKVNPVMSWGNTQLLSQTLCQGTDDEPMATLIRMCQEAEKEPGVLAATAFGGFALADMRDAGNSVIVVTDGDKAKADEIRDRILAKAWELKEDFIYKHTPLEEQVARAKAMTDGPILLLDHADNCGSGATQDVMTVIEEVLRQGLEDVAVAAVWDPAAVREMQKAGIGNEITLKLGGKTDMPSIGEAGEPLTLTGKVKTLTNGEWIVRGPMYTGVKVFMGPTAVLDTGNMEIVIVSNHHEPWDTGVFTSVGIQPEYKRYLILKSRIHYRAGFAPIGKATLTLDGKGVTTSDNNLLRYEKVRRPIYPLDLLNEA